MPLYLFYAMPKSNSHTNVETDKQNTQARRSTRNAKCSSSLLDSLINERPYPPAKRARLSVSSETDVNDPSSPKSIAPQLFRSYLSQYPTCVPEKLHALDLARYETIPAAVQSRCNRREDGSEVITESSAEAGPSKRSDQQGGARKKSREAGKEEVEPSSEIDIGRDGYLTKDEVVQLVEWKLKHGTFRPALLGMARAHPPDVIEDTTRRAFSELHHADSTSSTSALRALKTLCSLRGIGPATASLLLSCAAASEVPFFSDELYRWMLSDEPDTGKGLGWQRKIGYTDKEYSMLLEAVQRCRRTMSGSEWGKVGAMELEKVAYVLGRRE